MRLKIKKIQLVFFLLGCTFIGNAQVFKVINATRQQWSGGVAGRYGINYYIELETKNFNAVPDTVWMNGNAYPVSFSITGQGALLKKIDSLHHTITYKISEGETHDESTELNPENMLNRTVKNNTVKHVRHFNGAALISYQFKDKQHFFLIKQFKNLEPAAYP